MEFDFKQDPLLTLFASWTSKALSYSKEKLVKIYSDVIPLCAWCRVPYPHFLVMPSTLRVLDRHIKGLLHQGPDLSALNPEV